MIEITGGEEVNEFSSFKKIIGQQSQLTTAQLEKEVDDYLNKEKFDSAFKYADSGYQFTEKQLKLIKNKIYKMEVHEANNLFEKYPSIQQITKDSQFFFRILTVLMGDYFTASSKIIIYLHEEMKNKKFQKEFRDNFFQSIDNLLADNFFVRKIKDKDHYFYHNVVKVFHRYTDIILEDLTFNEFQQKFKKIQQLKKHVSSNWNTKSSNQINKNIHFHFEIDFKNKGEQKLEELLEKKQRAIEQLYMPKNINEFMVEKINQENINTKLEDLPEEAKEIIHQINQHYNLLKDKEELNENEVFTINNLMNKRLYEVIYKYLKVDEDFRETMRHINGKNTKELMLDSLCEIRQSLENIRIEQNEQHLSSLSVTNKYLKQRN